MTYIDRNEAIKRIRKALKAKSGKTWSVTGGRGTAWGWITVQAPPKRRVAHKANPEFKPWHTMLDCSPWIEYISDDKAHNRHLGDEERAELAELFGLDRPVHHQGLSISPDNTEFYVAKAEAGA